MQQVEGLLVKGNHLLNDINGKVETIDPLFTAVADLSASVSIKYDESKSGWKSWRCRKECGKGECRRKSWRDNDEGFA